MTSSSSAHAIRDVSYDCQSVRPGGYAASPGEESATHESFADIDLRAGRQVRRVRSGEREIWLGGRDSNPDNGVQSAVSYR